MSLYLHCDQDHLCMFLNPFCITVNNRMLFNHSELNLKFYRLSITFKLIETSSEIEVN